MKFPKRRSRCAFKSFWETNPEALYGIYPEARPTGLDVLRDENERLEQETRTLREMCGRLSRHLDATPNLSSDASASASDERPGTSLTPPEVEVPGLPNVSATTIAQACERIDILEQEVEVLQRVNQRLTSERDQAQAVASYYKYPHK